MLYVDKEIRVFLENGALPDSERKQTAVLNGDISCITNIGYDLRSRKFYTSDQHGVTVCSLKPGDSAFVESEEIVEFDNKTYGIVSLKNSRLRMGLTMDAPVYQPGHKTTVVFRVTNVSGNEITLCGGEKYAMLMFHQLSKEPDKPYSGAFQEESAFKGLSGYESQYSKQIKEMDAQEKDLKNIEKNLYGNVLAILTVFIGIFTLLNINIDLVKSDESLKTFLMFNLAVIGSISFLSVLLEELLHREKARHILWALPALAFAIMAVVIKFL